MSNKFRRVVFRYYSSPHFEESREEHNFTLRGIRDFTKGLQENQQYKITLKDYLSNEVGSTPDTILGEDVYERIKTNWDRRLSEIVINELVIVK